MNPFEPYPPSPFWVPEDAELMASLIVSLPKKPKVFVSYDHRNDQDWYDRFSNLFEDKYDLLTDTSIQRKIDSFDPNYQSHKIREDHITGSSITVVLIGRETYKRRHVDWELHATLEKEHALLGIVLPQHSTDWTGQNVLVPNRFLDNFKSGFAHWITWAENPADVENAIDFAKITATNTNLIQNSLEQLIYDLL